MGGLTQSFESHNVNDTQVLIVMLNRMYSKPESPCFEQKQYYSIWK